MRTGWTPAKSRTILRVWAVPGMARGVRRRPLPPSKSGRRRIVLSRSSVLPPIPLSGSRDRWPCAGCPLWISSPAPPDSSPVAAPGYLPTAPPRNASNRQSGSRRLTAPTGQNDQLSALLDDHRHAVDKRFDGVEKRFDGVEKRIDGIDSRLHLVEQSLSEMKGRFAFVEAYILRRTEAAAEEAPAD